jgi:DNA-binding winged helix-turn-helix (wHTH) protein
MTLRFGAFTLDSAARELRRDDAPVALSPKAFRLLELLIDARPHTVAHEALYDALWPDVVVEPGNLHVLVSEVRSVLGRESIRTVHRVGYAFTLDVESRDRARYSLFLGDEEIALRDGENGLGRDPRGRVVLHTPDVSRHHARIVVRGDVVTLEDLRSKNGTFLGRTRVTAPVQVHDGDEILIGTTRFRFARVDALPTTKTRT